MALRRSISAMIAARMSTSSLTACFPNVVRRPTDKISKGNFVVAIDDVRVGDWHLGHDVFGGPRGVENLSVPGFKELLKQRLDSTQGIDTAHGVLLFHLQSGGPMDKRSQSGTKVNSFDKIVRIFHPSLRAALAACSLVTWTYPMVVWIRLWPRMSWAMCSFSWLAM